MSSNIPDKVEINSAYRTWDTKTGPHFLSGLQIVSKLRDCHDGVMDVIVLSP